MRGWVVTEAQVAAKQEHPFDNEDNHDHRLKQKCLSLMKLPDHEAVQVSEGIELLLPTKEDL
jgi:hypothetical protein